LGRRGVFGVALIASVVAALYWGLIASDRYVSEARVIVQRTDLGGNQGMDVGSLLGGFSSGNMADQLLLRDHLLSVDMLKKLDARFNLRAHYSDWRRDPIARMWFERADLEWFHSHYLSRVSVDVDPASGILIIKTQAYDSGTALAIATAIVEEGERFMNAMAHGLARAQVAFLEGQVDDVNKRVMLARQIVLDFQNKNGLVSPQSTAENVLAIVNRLDGQLAELQTRRAALLGYLVPQSPNVVELNQQIAAIERQIKQERGRLASPNGKTLNRTVEEFQRLQMNAEFTQDVYKTALSALESGRVEATRTLKKLSVLQSPTDPQYPLEPRVIYNTILFTIAAFLIAGIVHLLAAVIRDHQD
jgi:capsular polysaccharide transport system permease protein